MVRIANTDKKETNWHISEIDPDVQYLIEPMKNSERVELKNYTPSIKPIGAKKHETEEDITWLTTRLFRASLKGLKGILDPDNGNRELELRFTTERISKRLPKLELCQREIYDKIPDDLLAEILVLIRGDSEVSEEEDEEIKNSSDSSQETNTDHAPIVTGTTTNAE